MSMSKDEFLKVLREDELRRGEMPRTQELYLDRMWAAYEWGITAGKEAVIDDLAALLKDKLVR